MYSKKIKLKGGENYVQRSLGHCLVPGFARLVVELTGRPPLSVLQIIDGFATAIFDIKTLEANKTTKG